MLLRSLTVCDSASPHHGKTVDLRVVDGKIREIGPRLAAQDNEPEFAPEAARVSPGFVDVGSYLGDPGHEEREDIAGLVAAATAGGYVTVATLPNTTPVRQSVADLAYLAGHNGSSAVDLLPLAAISRDTAGHDLTEMLELHAGGVSVFSDGPEKALSDSLLRRALDYARAFGGTLLVTPHSAGLTQEGQIHEGELSVRLGIQGIPTMAETIPLQRDLALARYTGGRLIVHLLSSAAGLAIYREERAASAGATLMASVSAHHLTFTAEELADFDPNFKLMPPLREASDREALLAGVLDGTVDAIVSHHQPRHAEEKDLEFSYAAFGARGLETAFRQLLSVTEGEAELTAVVGAFTAGPRRLLGLPPLAIEEGADARLTLFTTAGTATIGAADFSGRTLNSPLLNRSLPGRILATVNNQRLWTSA